MNIKEENKISQYCKKIRRHIIDTAYIAGADSSHFGGALSSVEIISTLFFSKMKYEVGNNNKDRDRFILSKGHGCLSYYAALVEAGYLKKSDLNTFEKNDSDLAGHPVMNRSIGIEFSNGSLGMGLSLGIGVAIAGKRKNKEFNVYVLMGDGECNEGSVWEGIMAAPNFKLSNLTIIIDNNGFQQTGSNKEILDIGNLYEKIYHFGWETINVDGHNIEEILAALNKEKIQNTPRAIIAKTIKGKGFSFSENNNNWHHAILSKNQYEIALKELSE